MIPLLIKIFIYILKIHRTISLINTNNNKRIKPFLLLKKVQENILVGKIIFINLQSSLLKRVYFTKRLLFIYFLTVRQIEDKSFKIIQPMSNQLNYYSRYNRTKKSQQKPIQSLYSLLSLNTLTKLANDATISLQMINLYNKKQKFKYTNYINIQNLNKQTSQSYRDNDEQNNNQQDQEYLQANFTSKRYYQHARSEEQQISYSSRIPITLNRSIELIKRSLSKSVESKRGNKNNSNNNRYQYQTNISPQKLERKKYLQELVREVRQKSKQRAEQQIENQKLLEKQRKKQRKKLLTSRNRQSKKGKNKSSNISRRFQSLNDSLEEQKQQDVDNQLLKNKQIREALIIVQKTLGKPTKELQQLKVKLQKQLLKTKAKQQKSNPLKKTFQSKNGGQNNQGSKKILQQQISLENKSTENHKNHKKSSQKYKNQGNSYVESLNDEQQNQQNSRHSVVIGRLNLGQGQIQTQNKATMNDLIKQYDHNLKKKSHSISKQDNPSSNQVKQEQIKSFSKQQQKNHKPNKNLIDLELSHSQSQKFEPLKTRDLQIPYDERNFIQVQKKQNNLTDMQFQNRQGEQQIILPLPITFKIQSPKNKRSNPLSNRTLSKADEQLKLQLQDKVNEKVQQIDQDYPMSKSYKIINSPKPTQFLSQINSKNHVEEPPYLHPLQYTSQQQKMMIQMQMQKILKGKNLQNEQNLDNSQVQRKSIELNPFYQNHQAYKKTSFKKFIMMSRQLNPRLVTSTILNEKNTNHKSRQHLKDQDRENSKHNQPHNRITNLQQFSPLGKQSKQKESRSLSKGNNNQNVQKKKNFKQMMNKKVRQVNNAPPNKNDQKIVQTKIPLKKLENQKLLQAFFNAN